MFNDTTGKFDNQFKYIDSLVENEILKIKYAISNELFQYLDSVPDRNVSILIDPSNFQDIFSNNIYYDIFNKIRQVSNCTQNAFETYTPLKVIDSLKITDLTKGANLISYSLFSKYLQQLEPNNYNSLLLILCERFDFFYVGNSKTLEDAIYFRRKLK